MLEARQAPGLVRMTDGPGSCNREIIADRPDPAKDIPLTLKRAEELGRFQTPEAREAAQAKMDEARAMPHQNVDYQRDGHPQLGDL